MTAVASTLLLMASAGLVLAQGVPNEGLGLGSLGADRARLQSIGGAGDSMPARRVPPGFSGHLLWPEVRVVSNSAIPYSLNDGALWAGRGMNASLTPAGVLDYRSGDLTARLTFAPTITYSENRPFQFLRGKDSTRSAFSSPWHVGSASADLPLRFGDVPIRTADLGQSSITVAARGISAGMTTENEWWGPGIRSTLVMSNNAPGVPRAFVRSAHPLDTHVGAFDAQLIAGTLTESRFFDTLSVDDYRSLSGILLTFRPALDTGLTIGLSRVVYAPVSRASGSVGHALDALTKWEPLARPSDTLAGGRSRQTTDQLLSVFGRWAFPDAGFEVYGELSRMELPRSLREWLVAPQNTQGYLVGLQSVRSAILPRSFVRFQAELTYLEQATVLADRPPPDYYTGRAAVQGYTQRGRVIGAATGPGSSSQWVAADFLAPRWQAGIFIGRTRWENDVLYRSSDPRVTRHDVTILSGLRGGLRLPFMDALSELTIGRRLNYLFQNEAYVPGEGAGGAIDVQNITLSILLTPR